MKLIAKRADDIVVIDVFGEINIQSVNQLKRSIEMIIEHGICKVVLNLKPTDYIDSVGMGTLVGLEKKLLKLEGELYLVGVQPNILKAFEMVRLKKMFKQFDTKKDAIEYFRGDTAKSKSNIDDILAEAKDILGLDN